MTIERINSRETEARPRLQGLAIDPPGAVVIDDAIEVNRKGKTGRAHICVSIIDPTGAVPLGSALNEQALRHLETRYFRGGSRPMLPDALIRDRLSMEHGFAPTLSIGMRMDRKGSGIEKIWIGLTQTNCLRFTFAQADEAMLNHHPQGPALRTAYMIGQNRMRARRDRTGMKAPVYDLEAGGWVDEEGNFIVLPPEQRHRSFISVQEAMILANTVAAQKLAEAGWLALWTHNPAPGLPAMIGLEPGWHAGLELGAYLKLTSPGRKYYHFANMQTLRAYLLGLPPPYTPDQLIEIAERVNTRIPLKMLRRAPSSVPHKEIPRPVSCSQVYRKIQTATNEEDTDRVLENLDSYLKRQRLRNQDLYQLLFEDGSGLMWETTRKKVLAYLSHKPGQASTVLFQWCEKHGLDKPSVTTGRQDGLYTARITFWWQEHAWIIEESDAKSFTAKRQAYFRLLELIVQNCGKDTASGRTTG